VHSHDTRLGPHIEVTHAKRREIADISQVWLEFMDTHQRTDASFTLAPRSIERWVEMAYDIIDRRDTFLLVAKQQSMVVGFCLGWVAKNPPIYAVREVGFISELAVKLHHRRQGIGRALLHEAREWCFTHGLREFQLSTAIWNVDAQRFWEAEGGSKLLLRYKFTV
jgi:GNAT superfamily N-acetyltransferase